MIIQLKGLNSTLGRGVVEVRDGVFIANVYFKIRDNGQIVKSQMNIIRGIRDIGLDEFRSVAFKINIMDIIRDTPEYKQYLLNPREVTLYDRGRR